MGLIAVERVASSTFLGLVLGWLCWTTRSVVPGMLLHAVNNAVMLSLVYGAEQWRAWGYDPESQRYLPLPLVVITTATALVAAVGILWLARRQIQASRPSQTPHP